MDKHNGILTWAILALVGLWSCTSYKAQQQYQKLQQPILGSVVHHGGEILGANKQVVGQLGFKKHLTVKVIERPFNNHSYGQYTSYLKNARKANTVPYNDSLPIAPKYLRLVLQDQVLLTQLLNNTANAGLKEYIAQDDKYTLVTSIDMTATDERLSELLNADHVFLVHDDYGKRFLQLINGTDEQWLSFEEIQQFNHETLSFCWAEDRYLKKQVVNLLAPGQRCPKGSHKKAAKAAKEREYLKF